MSINKILTLDALTCAAMGVLLSLAAPSLSPILSLPQGLLFGAGLVLLPIALFMATLALMARPAAAAVWLVILGNAAWVLASLGVILAVTPNALGIIFLLAQAGVVAGLTLAEHRVLTRREASGFARAA